MQIEGGFGGLISPPNLTVAPPQKNLGHAILKCYIAIIYSVPAKSKVEIAPMSVGFVFGASDF